MPKQKVKLDDDNHPIECPRDDCEGTDIAISNLDGYECCECGCWFECITPDRYEEGEPGSIEWAWDSAPGELL